MRRTLWILALAAGYVDGLGLLYLGGVFGGVLAGNLVVLGVSAVQQLTGTALRAGLAAAVYAVTVPLAGRLPPSRCLVAELLALCTLCGGWVVAHHDPRGLTQLPLLTLAALAMGLQRAAVRDAHARPADRRFDAVRLASYLGIPAGAVGAGLLLDRVPWAGPLPAVVLVVSALLLGHRRPPSVPAAAPQPQHRESARLQRL